MLVFDNLYVYLYQVDDQELAIVFMKVDANCDGTVDWVRDGFLIIVLIIFGVGRLLDVYTYNEMLTTDEVEHQTLTTASAILIM